jgi:hypothetical protein
MKKSSQPLLLFIVVSFSALFWVGRCDYIRSEELVLSDDLELGSSLINLNKLMQIKKKQLGQSTYLFKLVNDSLLINFIELKFINSDTNLIVLKRKLAFDEICNGKMDSCYQSIKIIAVNENDFIEVNSNKNN